jgi:hypothetical protein
MQRCIALFSTFELAEHLMRIRACFLVHRCKYENQVFPLHAPRRREEEPDINESMNAQVKATGIEIFALVLARIVKPDQNVMLD